VASRGRNVKRGVEIPVYSLGISAIRKKYFHDLKVAFIGRNVKWGVAMLGDSIGVSAILKKCTHHATAAMAGSNVKGCLQRVAFSVEARTNYHRVWVSLELE
jgi:hypothetical protein